MTNKLMKYETPTQVHYYYLLVLSIDEEEIFD